eukprot:jgi/Mesvir1/24794/Mv22046-RA.1
MPAKAATLTSSMPDGVVLESHRSNDGVEARCARRGQRKILVQTDGGNSVTIELDRSDKLDHVRRKVQDVLRVSTDQSSVYFGGLPIENSKALREIGDGWPVLLKGNLKRSQSSPCLSPGGLPVFPVGVQVIGKESAESVRDVVKEVTNGMECGIPVERASGGLGGVYFFKNDQGKVVAVVKPTDEEPMAPNNPNGFVGRRLGEPGLKPAIRVGEAAVREVAAFLIDRDFAHVPRTAMAQVSHSCFHSADVINTPLAGKIMTKLCSFQEYKEHDSDASDMSFSMFPTSAVHRIGILDLRIYNSDRHSGNILVRRLNNEGQPRVHGRMTDQCVELIPIDHGFCLSENPGDVYFEWLHWPQASLPFSREELDFIASINVAEDIAMLRREVPMLPEGSLRMLEITTALLKRGAEGGLVLSEIGQMMSRPNVGVGVQLSELEEACIAAMAEVEEDLTNMTPSEAGSAKGGNSVAESVEEEEGDYDAQEFQFQFDDVEEESGDLSAGDRSLTDISGRNGSHFSRDGAEDSDEDAGDEVVVSPFYVREGSSCVMFPKGGRKSLLVSAMGDGDTSSKGSLGASPATPIGCDSPAMGNVRRRGPHGMYATKRKEAHPPVGVARSLMPGGGFWGSQKVSHSPAATENSGLIAGVDSQGNTTKPFRLSDMSESVWRLFLTVVMRNLDESIVQRRASRDSLNRMGTSCLF